MIKCYRSANDPAFIIGVKPCEILIFDKGQ